MNSKPIRFLPEGHPVCVHGIPFDSECPECSSGCAQSTKSKVQEKANE